MGTKEKALAGGVASCKDGLGPGRPCLRRRRRAEATATAWPSRVRYLTLPSALRQRTPSADVHGEAASHRLPTGLAFPVEPLDSSTTFLGLG